MRTHAAIFGLLLCSIAIEASGQQVIVPNGGATVRNAGVNELVLESLEKIPDGGGYAATSTANAKLAASIGSIADRIQVRPEAPRPSYCSGATYFVLLQALTKLQKAGQLPLSSEAATQLKVNGQPDGVGVWGRWNANGPGTAVLVHELGAGHSFTEVEKARPGDFLKIFWKDAVGKNERGHSVIFLSAEEQQGVPGILFWSSNKPGGYGKKWVPKTKIARMLFTRVDRPAAFANAVKLSPKNTYLSSMLTRESSFEEALKMSGAPAK